MNYFHTLLIIIVLTFYSVSNCFTTQKSWAASQAGTSGAGSVSAENTFSEWSNPALPLKAPGIYLGGTYCNPYSIQSLQYVFAHIHFEGPFTAGIDYSLTQLEQLYASHILSFTLATPRIYSFKFGVRFNTIQEQFPHNPLNTYTMSSGVTYQPLPHLSLGFNINHIAQIKTHYQLPLYMAAGITYTFYKTTSLSFNIQQGELDSWEKSIGAQFSLNNYCAISLGVSSNPYQWSLGITLSLFNQKIYSARTSHPTLGTTRISGVEAFFPIE